MSSSIKVKGKKGIVVIGIGNEYRGDDGAGLYVAQQLKKHGLRDVIIIEEKGDGLSLMDSWKDTNNVILVDAIYSGEKPGTIHKFSAHTHHLSANMFHCSTHAFGVAEAIELARSFDQLPSCMTIYGIEGKCFEEGVGLSLEVERAAHKVLTRMLHDIRSKAWQQPK